MDASFVGGTIIVPRIFWGQSWFDENCVEGEENTCDTYIIKKFKPDARKGTQDVAACIVFDAGVASKDRNYHVTQLDLDQHKANGMKIGMCVAVVL